MLVELDDELTKCSICMTKFSSDRDSTDPEIRKHLPVLSSSQRCDHWFCHGCILREQLRVAGEKNGRVPKWVKCMHCREKTSFNPAEPKYHRMLIDLIARAQKYAAAQVKNEDGEMSADAQLGSDENAACTKREVDAVDYEEREVKRPKLMTPSPPLVQIKDEPVEYGDQYAPQLLLENASPPSEIIQSAIATPLVCSTCKVPKSRCNFSERDKLKGDAAVCNECKLNDNPKLRPMREALNTAEEELKKLKRAIYNIADRPAEGLGDSVENEGGRSAQLTREEVSYEALQAKLLMCSISNYEKELKFFSNEQQKHGEAARCEKCIVAFKKSAEQPQVLLCNTCKEMKELDSFSKNQQRLQCKGAASCIKCMQTRLIDEAKVMLLCSSCNEVKKLDCFPKNQRKQGEAACCLQCVYKGKEAKVMLLCSSCNEVKKLDRFSKTQRKRCKQKEAARCKKCIYLAVKSSAELLCSTCKEVLELDRFSKKQRKQGEAACCKKCVDKDKEAKAPVKCSAEKPQMLLCCCQQCMDKEAKNPKCINKEAKASVSVVNTSAEEPQMMLRCTSCKEVKKLDCFSKMQQSLGEAVCCLQCIDKEANTSVKHSAEKPVWVWW